MKEKLTRISKKTQTILTRLTKVLFFPLLIFARKVSLPGFKGVSIYNVGLFFIEGMKKSSITIRANAISYSFIIAFVPAVIFRLPPVNWPIPDSKQVTPEAYSKHPIT